MERNVSLGMLSSTALNQKEIHGRVLVTLVPKPLDTALVRGIDLLTNHDPWLPIPQATSVPSVSALAGSRLAMLAQAELLVQQQNHLSRAAAALDGANAAAAASDEANDAAAAALAAAIAGMRGGIIQETVSSNTRSKEALRAAVTSLLRTYGDHVHSRANENKERVSSMISETTLLRQRVEALTAAAVPLLAGIGRMQKQQ